jgi:thymidylate kinase
MFVAVAGAAPGVGKSTLATALAGWLSAQGLAVDHFREEEILSRPEFAAVAAEFRAGGGVALATLRAAVAGYVTSIRAARTDVVVADALLPFVPSLLAWGHSEAAIADFLADLAGVLEPVTPILLFLDGDPQTALPRAAAREGGPEWLDWFLAKLGVPDVPAAAAVLTRQRDVTLRVVPWPVHVIETDTRTPDDVLRAARAVFGTRPPDVTS